jgi:hypothetical protein
MVNLGFIRDSFPHFIIALWSFGIRIEFKICARVKLYIFYLLKLYSLKLKAFTLVRNKCGSLKDDDDDDDDILHSSLYFGFFIIDSFPR